MVRTPNTWNLDRPQKHSEDDIIGEVQPNSPREKRPLPKRGDFLGAGRKMAKHQRALPGGLGAQFRLLGGGGVKPPPVRELTPRLKELTPRLMTSNNDRCLETKQPVQADDSDGVQQNIWCMSRESHPRLDNNYEGDTETANETPDFSPTDSSNQSPTNQDDDCTATTVKVSHSDNTPASGQGVDPKFMTRQTFRSRVSDDRTQLADQLKAMGQVCTPLCSPRRLDRRRRKRAQKRIQPHLQEQAKPSVSVLHPPCVVSGAIYSVLAIQYEKRYKRNLMELYNKQLEKEVNIERFSRESSKRKANALQKAKACGQARGVTGKYSNVCNDVDETSDSAASDSPPTSVFM